ncbi:MAG: nucleotide exchange factor GrpE [Lachnospiraceae bacterium]|nr:nucleotide exchange factor GrpE [Lachnospiraceae bacterium]
MAEMETENDIKEEVNSEDSSFEEKQQGIGDEEASASDASAPEAGGDTSDGVSEESMSRAEKKAAKKQSRADKKEEEYKEKIEQLEDRVKRQMAEFENFRRRSDREKQAMFETGARSVIEKMLPVVDNLERGLQTVSPEAEKDPFVDGINKVYKQLMTELENMGVKPIEALGCEFDPNLHNAVIQVESDEYESGVVAQELQKGYTYHDTVIRHSMVAVSS